MSVCVRAHMEDGRDPRFSDESRAYTQFMRTGFPAPNSVAIEGIRQRAEDLHKKVNEKLIGKFKGQEIEKKVRISGNIDIPVTIYTPIDVNKDKMVVFFHGGGWIINSRKTHQTIVNMLADATKSIWISVEYRLSPENKFPIWLDDACEVTRHILANKTAYGGNENTKVGVAGDSGGGLTAASVCHTIDNLDFQILICGQFEYTRTLPSHQEFDQPIFVLTTDVRNWFSSNAYNNENERRDPRISVLHNKIPNTIPPCLVIVAELDPLRDDSYNYEEVLNKAGVKTKLVLIKGAIHPYFSLPGIFAKSCQQTIDAVQEFMTNL
ncbi:hypothetical protein I4U23_019154 [Adineta vaga]|nr:hypothetical protein I4U23_019154 [Adineta vaga]